MDADVDGVVVVRPVERQLYARKYIKRELNDSTSRRLVWDTAAHLLASIEETDFARHVGEVRKAQERCVRRGLYTATRATTGQSE